jgi:D-threonate/D-erythronate kinase
MDETEERRICDSERLGMIADDLTGACDTGVMFARHGFRTVVLLDRETNSGLYADLLVLTTDSRTDPPNVARGKMQQACRFLQAQQTRLLYKKIDSVMRGNIGPETEVAIEEGQHPFAVLTPAFPAMGRTLESGVLHVDAFSPQAGRHLPSLLAEQGLDRVAHIPLATLYAGGGVLTAEMERLHGQGFRYLVADAVADSDLETLARAALSFSPLPLLVGSGGLAAQVAALLYARISSSRKDRTTEAARVKMPDRTSQNNVTPLQDFREGPEARAVQSDARRKVMLFVGSTHPVTRAQITCLTQDRICAEVPLDASAGRRTLELWAEGRHPLFTIRWEGEAEEEAIQALSSLLPGGAVLLSGGDTAATLCRLWGASGLCLEKEILTGLPMGRLLGGRLDGLTVCTKSGGFGAEYALLHAVRYLEEGT